MRSFAWGAAVTRNCKRPECRRMGLVLVRLKAFKMVFLTRTTSFFRRIPTTCNGAE